MNKSGTGLKWLVIFACFSVLGTGMQAQAHPGSTGRSNVTTASSSRAGSAGLSLNTALSQLGGKATLSNATISQLLNSKQGQLPPQSNSGGSSGPVSTTTLPGTQSDSQTDISAVLTGDWASWTGSSNGTLTVAQLASLIANPQITGSQAVVLGMVGNLMNNYILNTSGSAPPYTLAQVQTSLSTNGASNTFMNTMANVASATNSNGTFNLYGAYSAANYSITQQGSVMGDCYFLSSINSVLNQGATALTGMIRPMSSDTFKVIFPLAAQFGLPTKQLVTLTAGDIALMNQSGVNGAYLTIFGLAENQLLIQYSNAGLTNYKLTATVAEAPLAPLGDGGYSSQMLSLLTGQTYENINYNHKKWTTSFVDAVLAKDFSGNKAVPVEIDSNDHVLSIIGYNAQTQNVTIHNPWGTNGLYGYNQDSGIRNQDMEVEMQNGVFVLSTANMLADFSTLCVQKSLLQNITPSTDVFIKGLISAPGTALFTPSATAASASARAAIAASPLSMTNLASVASINAALVSLPALNLASTLAQIQSTQTNFGNYTSAGNRQALSFNAPSAEVSLDAVGQTSCDQSSLCSAIARSGANLVDTADYVDDASDCEQTAMK